MYHNEKEVGRSILRFLEAEKDNIVQEELYVHGKVCIVDDRIAICGSANINDRVSSDLSEMHQDYFVPSRPRSPILTVFISCSPNLAPTIANSPS